MSKLLIMIIRSYQLAVSPLLGHCCRFYPSCSSYCVQAIQKHGWLKGLILGVQRIGKCHPFHSGGVDNVP